MSDHEPHLQPDVITGTPAPPKHELSATAWSAISKLIGERIAKADEQTIEDVAGVMGEALKGVDQRLDPLEAEIVELAQQRQRLILAVKEHRLDMEAMVAALGDDLAFLKRQLNAMQAENDILRQCLSLKHTMKAADSISMLRSIR